MKFLKFILIVLIVIAAAFTIRLYYLGGNSNSMKVKLGLIDGKLTPCPDKPNCVCSQEDGEHFIEPITSSLNLEEVKNRILKLPRVRLETEGDNYVHFTFKSKLFKFVDDLELVKENGTFQVRSASRVGYSDMGVNKKRVEMIRELLSK